MLEDRRGFRVTSEFRTNSSRSEELLSNNPFRRCQSEVPVPPADFQRRQKKSPATERTKTCELPDQLSFSGKSWLLNPPRNDKFILVLLAPFWNGSRVQ